MKITKKLIFAIFLCQLAGIIGSIFTLSAIPEWYSYLEKPALIPPNWLFGPVWLILYTVMGISLYRIWLKQNIPTQKKKSFYITYSLHLFYIHMIINAFWSIVFFGIKDTLSALVIITTLDVFITILSIWFYRYDRIAGLLLLPYLAWVLFATYLNFAIWYLNDSGLL